MNRIEKALMHALFKQPHHNIDKLIDFKVIEELNRKVSQIWPGVLLVGPGDDAGVFQIPGTEVQLVAKMESHCSPSVPRPYGAAATGAGGAMRDVTAMGARPIVLLDDVAMGPVDEKVLVGSCPLRKDFTGQCLCGQCKEMTNQERLNLIIQGIKDMCATMDVFVLGGGLSTSIKGMVPAVMVTVIGILMTEKPLTKPAKKAGDKIIIVGATGNDGNDTLFRAGLVPEMRPAEALFEEERVTADATLAAFRTGKIQACSDLGAAGIGAAVCESARYGSFGAKVDLSKVPVKVPDITPEEILICETQARMVLQVSPEDVDEVMEAIQSPERSEGCEMVAETSFFSRLAFGSTNEVQRTKNGVTAVIGEITDDDQEVFEYEGKTVATIPNKPSEEILTELRKGG